MNENGLFVQIFVFILNAFSRSRKMLENQLNLGSDRTEILEVQLKEARALAAESDKKYDEVSCLVRFFVTKKCLCSHLGST
jgi:hypothetical protein